MNLILLGAPGAGKGTQAELLTQKLGIPAISTGNMLREAMRNDTETGREVTYYMDNGIHFTNIGQEFITKSFPFRSTFYNPCYICKFKGCRNCLLRSDHFR